MTGVSNETEFNYNKIDTNQNIMFMYPGQGSQYFGMARTLFIESAIFRRWMEKLDGVVESITGKSVIQELYFSDKTALQTFDRIIYTHPAIFMVEYSLTQMLKAEGIRPTALIGSSLGVFTCLSAAGSVLPEEMLEFIVRQAMIFEDKCQSGGMIAIIDDYRLFCNLPLIYCNAELVSINYDNHFVVSGDREGINIVEDTLIKSKITYLRLPVSFGFHSKNLDPAYDEFIHLARKLHIVPPKLPIYANKDLTIAENINPEFLWKTVRGNIEFSNILQDRNLNQFKMLLDVGPSGTLANIAKSVLRQENEIDIFGIISKFHEEKNNIEKIKKKIN
ncbi:acyltransferase domain-containing protein [Paenibacillus apiarius]|uniref:acyltransferase domain-containing protein n=1 Tax=Paenibacillus apiarius TaxID=46240 RepID=UPI001981E3EC|nr:acyltransferase domain-containing protein [Paenibacillus apiarius]MBN3526382.1 acyltransferase domain-containing protein [Paenibacillus apiarius]